MFDLAHSENGDAPEERGPQAVFHPIDLNSSDDDTDDDEPETLVARTKPMFPKGAIPTLEDAIQECLSMAVNTHDAPLDEVSKAVWDWQVQSAKAHPIPKVDPKTEEEALKSWIPRPLFLPTWATKED